MIPPGLTLSNIRYVSKVKLGNPGKGVAPSPTPQCSSYWKGSLLVTLDYGWQQLHSWSTLFHLSPLWITTKQISFQDQNQFCSWLIPNNARVYIYGKKSPPLNYFAFFWKIALIFFNDPSACVCVCVCVCVVKMFISISFSCLAFIELTCKWKSNS